jgi:hypothetical protein
MAFGSETRKTKLTLHNALLVLPSALLNYIALPYPYSQL